MVNPEFLTAFASSVATSAVAVGVTAALTLRKVLWRSGAWEDHVARDARGIDALTGLYNRDGFVSAVEDFQVTAAETNESEYLLCVLAYNGFRDIEATYGALGAERVLACIGTELQDYAVDDLACRFKYPCFSLVTTAEYADQLTERMQVAVCSSTTRYDNALRIGDRFVFPVFGKTAGLADETYGPAIHLELGIDEAGVDHNVDAHLDLLAMCAADEFLEAGRCRN